MTPNDGDSTTMANTKTAILTNIANRYSGDAFNYLVECTVLDPRFRSLPQLDQDQCKAVFLRVQNKAEQLLQKQTTAEEREEGAAGGAHCPTPSREETVRDDEPEVTGPAPKKTALEDLLGNSFSTEPEGSSSSKQAEREVENYRKGASIPLSGCPLKWWQEHCSRYPLLSQLAKACLSVPATSVPSITRNAQFAKCWSDFKDINLVFTTLMTKSFLQFPCASFVYRAICTEHQSWQLRHRRLVLFTDESRFYLSTCDRRDRLWRRRGECYAVCNIIQHDWFGGGSVMVWGGISLEGRTDLYRLDNGTLTAIRYQDEILGPVVRHYAGAVGPGFLVVHNNAWSNVARVCRQIMENEGTDTIDWPTGSPDLNPIEHLWDIMFRSIRRHQVAPQTVQELSDAVVQIWEEIPQDTLGACTHVAYKHEGAIQTTEYHLELLQWNFG
ncbi:hypothetical protein NFI96_009756 [Prochilodus magdalenae]|nr:hypothetical protein NFI96_009756 [Prochilodus magdalenae]